MSKDSTIDRAMNDLYYELDGVLNGRQTADKDYAIDLIHRMIDILEKCKDKD